MSGIKTDSKQVRDNLKKIAEGFFPMVADALREEMYVEKAEVIENTPIDKGPLRDTITVVEPTIEGNTVTSYITAGSDEVDYAFYVHEDMEAFHKVGGPKYIENVMNESEPHMPDRVGRRLDISRLIR
jgi:hypothetical protein